MLSTLEIHATTIAGWLVTAVTPNENTLVRGCFGAYLGSNVPKILGLQKFLVSRSVALHAGDVVVAVWWTPGLLAFPEHGAQTFHGLVVGLVQRIALVGQQFHRLAYAARLVYAALLADRQVHGQMQKRVGACRVHRQHGGQRGVQVGKIGVVLGVLIHPARGNGFNGFQRQAVAGLGKGFAKKATHVFL